MAGLTSFLFGATTWAQASEAPPSFRRLCHLRGFDLSAIYGSMKI
jgi:hypothetical protein